MNCQEEIAALREQVQAIAADVRDVKAAVVRSRKWLDTREAAHLLGMPEHTLRRVAHSLPFAERCPNGRWRFDATIIIAENAKHNRANPGSNPETGGVQ